MTLVEEIREAAYAPQAADASHLSPWRAVSFARRATQARDTAALDYLKGHLVAHLWRPAPPDEAVMASILWAASEELLLQTKRCRARRLSLPICHAVARIIKATWSDTLDPGEIVVTAQEGVSRHFLQHYGRADSDCLRLDIRRIGDLCHIEARAARKPAPTNREHPITATCTGTAGARFLGAWDLDGTRALHGEVKP